MKLALQLNVIDPKIGGVMIWVIVEQGNQQLRALADLLPDITIIKNDPFNTNPGWSRIKHMKLKISKFLWWNYL